MQANRLREQYLNFFEARGHRRLPSASLLPENDPTVLFTTAGMHPLVPFLLGEAHPLGRRLVNFQKCIRTNDIAEVGDAAHLTFFEMLGNWSLGDYYKSESLAWSYEFLTQTLGIRPEQLAVTVFAGDAHAPRDDESAAIWRRLGIPSERIFFLPREDNWWGPAGITGPCGPDSEIFVDTDPQGPGHPGCHPGCPCGKWLEIWNNVFMAYEKTTNGAFVPLRQPNVDTGMGVERILAVLHALEHDSEAMDVFRVETVYPLIEMLEELSGRAYKDHPAPFRIIADHVRAATFAISDGATPSNVEAGYVVRRILRRAVRAGQQLGVQGDFCVLLSNLVADLFAPVYPALAQNQPRTAEILAEEEAKFKHTLERGQRHLTRVFESVRSRAETVIPGADAFDLFETHGIPLSLTVELAQEQGLQVDEAGFARRYEEHQSRGRESAEKKYKGGLADQSAATTALHTASHLLQQALRQVLGPTVRQMGSNITPERLRFDFFSPVRLTPEQLAEVERIVNAQIERSLPVSMEIMSPDQAAAAGALAFFSEKYGEQVKVYSIGDFSKEVCGGPHVSNTSELGTFKILKEESVKHNVRRIRAVLEEK
jgi:alanyl-tRNA synthetase